MTTNFQKRSLKLWHKALLRLTLPIIWVFILACTVGTVSFIGPICGVAAFVSWVIVGNPHAKYTIVPAVIPLILGFMYVDWLKENDVINDVIKP